MNGTYGTRRPADITSEDVDIYYHYRPNRSSDSPDFQTFRKLDSSYLLNSKVPDGNVLQGMYDLRLPLTEFGEKGIYTIYIKPKEYELTIVDVSTLAAYPDVRGIVLKTNTKGIDQSIFVNGGLVGYRVEYRNSETHKSEYRLITSNNRCEPVSQNLNDTSQKGVRYRFNDSSNITFCTLTPSAAMTFKSNSLPYIGYAGETITLVNTKFNPVMLEIEMTEHDIETVSTMLEGEQVRNLDKGMITTFNEDGEIYHQAKYGNITNTRTGIHHDFKLKNRTVVDNTESEYLREITNNID